LSGQFDDRIGGGDQPIHVTIMQVLGQVGQSQRLVQEDFTDLIREIGKVQQALNVDFVQVLGDLQHSFEVQTTKIKDERKPKNALRIHQDAYPPNVPALDLSEPMSPTNSLVHGQGGNMRSSKSQGWAAANTAARPFQDLGDLGSHDSMETTPSNPPQRRHMRRLREFWTQTDNFTQAHASIQTDEVRKPEKKRKKVHASRIEVLEAKPFLVHAPAPKPTAVFADIDSMKKNVRRRLIRPQFNVFDLYKETGFFQMIAKSRMFDNVTFFLIFVNAAWIAVDADFNNAVLLVDADPQFIIMENIFCAYFVFEVIVRWVAFERKRDCVQDRWFVFDCILVLLMVAETWILSLIVIIFFYSNNQQGLNAFSVIRLIRVVKMLRVSRMARLLRAIPEIVILVRGIGAASRSVLIFCTLWFVIIYVFAIVLKTFIDGHPTGNMQFQTVWSSANTLLLNGVFPMHGELVNDVSEAHWGLWIVMMIFVLLAAVTLTNMLVGVMVETISAIASTEKEALIVLTVAKQLRECMARSDRDGTKDFDRQEFVEFIFEPDVIRVAQDNGVDIIALEDTADVIFEDFDKHGIEMDFEAFVNVFLNMRGTNVATVKDVKEQMRTTKAIVNSSLNSVLGEVKEEFTLLREELFEREKEHMAQQKAFLQAIESADESGDDSDGYTEAVSPKTSCAF
jgi:hypothetical protein